MRVDPLFLIDDGPVITQYAPKGRVAGSDADVLDEDIVAAWVDLDATVHQRDPRRRSRLARDRDVAARGLAALSGAVTDVDSCTEFDVARNLEDDDPWPSSFKGPIEGTGPIPLGWLPG